MKINKIDIVIFLFCIFFQNFALYHNASFGLAALTFFLIYIGIKNKYYKNIDKNFIKLCVFILATCLLSSVINYIFNYMTIIRLFMVLFDVYVSYRYIKDIYKDNKEYFFKVFKIMFCIVLVNGLYQLLASNNHLPVFLNIFNNNTSYGGKEIYQTYNGWSESFRIYSTSFEPSMHCFMVDFAFFFLLTLDKNKKSKFNIIIYLLALANIVLTFSRSGWIVFIIFIGSYILYKLLCEKFKFKIPYIIIMLLMPFICLGTMYYIGQKVFPDSSSVGRTYSAIHYINKAKARPRTLVIGRSIGSLFDDFEKSWAIMDGKWVPIEPYAHNGYVEVIYQLGIPFLIIFLLCIVKFIESGKEKKYNWLAYASFVSLFCFAKTYAVESASSLVTIIVFASMYKEEIKGKKKKA